MLINYIQEFETWGKLYFEQYPDDEGGFGEPGDMFLISYGKDHENSVIEPDGETPEKFLDRLERSKKEGRNLFYEEWPKFEYEEGCLY